MNCAPSTHWNEALEAERLEVNLLELFEKIGSTHRNPVIWEAIEFIRLRQRPSPSAEQEANRSGRIPDLEGTRLNAEYWRNGAKDESLPLGERLMALDQAVNAWKNAAYAMADQRDAAYRESKEAEWRGMEVLRASVRWHTPGYMPPKPIDECWLNEARALIAQERDNAAAMVQINPICRASFNSTDGWQCDCEYKHPLACSKTREPAAPVNADAGPQTGDAVRTPRFAMPKGSEESKSAESAPQAKEEP